jgi:hypothetical protein
VSDHQASTGVGEQAATETGARAGLPAAEGPLVRVRLHDGQTLYAVVRGRQQERDRSWWYRLQIHLPAPTEADGVFSDQPAPVDFVAPAARCDPIDGQPYDIVPTSRHGVPPPWTIEKP